MNAIFRYAIKRSDGRYMCIFMKKCSKKIAQNACDRYSHCKVVKIKIEEIENEM